MVGGAARLAIAIAILLGGCDRVFGVDDPDRIDAPGFDCTTLASYSVQLPSTPGVRYRIDETSRMVWAQASSCANDAKGSTHLWIPTKIAEIDEMKILFGSTDRAFIGAVQNPDAVSLTAGWRMLTGESFDVGFWATNEPDDNEGIENGDEQVGTLSAQDDGIIDVPVSLPGTAICECDGRAVDPEVQAILDAYR